MTISKVAPWPLVLCIRTEAPLHRLRPKDEIAERAAELLRLADLPPRVADARPAALSGGLLARLRDSLGLALPLITHNLAVVSAVCVQAAVMRSGRIVEQAVVPALLACPRHPYTRQLLLSRLPIRYLTMISAYA